MSRTFGLMPSRGSGRGRGTFRRRGSGAVQRPGSRISAALARSNEVNAASQLEARFDAVRAYDAIDERMGFVRFDQGETKQAWLVNMHPTLLSDDAHPSGRSGVDYYFIQDDASMFKVTILYLPYFLVGCYPGTESVVEEWVRRRFEGLVQSVERNQVDDLKLANHLVGNQRTVLRLRFHNVHDLLTVRKELLPLADKAQKEVAGVEAYANVLQDGAMPDVHVALDGEGFTETGRKTSHASGRSAEQCIVALYEYDVPYYLRVAIDNDIRVGLWYDVSFHEGIVELHAVPERVKRADPVVMAFDIETTKQPLKFPDAETDMIMMISYMIDGQGFLITNREVVSEDIDDFEYTPKEEYDGPFIIFNEKNEMDLLRRFFSHVQDARPTVIATYNGDSFDFPFVETRAKAHGLDMLQEIGFAPDSDSEYKSRHCAHLDCFRWVKRDSYLPQGSQGLKAVTVAKLGYDPMELDPELMTPYASEQPQTLAQYSVSDAVATYYLYMKYVHPFIFSLCNIIPLNPDEVLRKGSGTLCETLLMVQAYKSNILMPNRHIDPIGNTYDGHLLESETYVGGHVEALEAGIFRNDIPTHFQIEPAAIQELIDELDSALAFSIREEGKMAMADIEDYDTVKGEILAMLEQLRDNPVRQDKPLIYHLDVAAMYPNIMLSNRLQPDSVVDEGTCASCDYNRPGMQCDKRMKWAWRGEYFPAKRDEINMIRHALDMETFPAKDPHGKPRAYQDLSAAEQSALLQRRIADYSKKVYKRAHDTKTVVREAIICQRENPFYIDTVRDFRDRRYEYKGLLKTWKQNMEAATQAGNLGEKLEAGNMIVLYDSLQLAHKCILNSFYGYVMRKGARWYSMEMAGITCLTGATIIQMAKELVDRIGRPLELDTDGIWCMLPRSFPENFSFRCRNGKKLGLSYPCTMLNYRVHQRFTNHQYHDLVDPQRGTYDVHSENSIFFELDGPYRAMILPSSKEEDKLLKKRYAVFNQDGSLAELKGFEVKRRGELQLIKDFQKQIFAKFLLGDSLVHCYAAVAQIADQWLDVLYSKGSTLHDEELIDLIAENKSMSKLLSEYGTQKSTAITTAKRLAEMLGSQVVKNKGLACKFIVSAKPYGAPVAERAVPVAIFNAEPDVKIHFLRRFLKDASMVNVDLRSILDWDYYIERFAGVIQKLITIPAAMQKVPNPVPRVRHPDWLLRRVAVHQDRITQTKLSTLMSSKAVQARTRAPPVPAPVPAPVPVPVREELIPDMHTDYPGWVSAMHRCWRKRRAERKAGAASGGPQTLGSMLQQHTAAMAGARWDIVQLAPTSHPGEYRLWVYVARNLQCLKLRVPRQLYVNFKRAPPPALFLPLYHTEHVTRTLPRGVPCLHLVRILVQEDVFLAHESHFSALLNHPNVDGVYEMHVPLDIRAMLQLGASCTLRSSVKLHHALDTGFCLADLTHVSHDAYLGGGRAMRHLYLYHATLDKRHVFVLVGPDGTTRVHLVDTAGLRQWPAVESLYAERLDAMRRAGRIAPGRGAFDYPDTLQSAVRVHRDSARAFAALGKDIRELRMARPGATQLAVCSARPFAYYDAQMHLSGELPVLMIPAARQEDALPPLGWQLYAARRFVNCYVRTAQWIERWVALASHLDVPLGNMQRDFAVFGSDMDFARRMLQNDMVLWWSQSARPDLGGRENDAHAGYSTELETLEITHAGAYSDVCLEVSLGDLALNVVLQYPSVNAMEGLGTASMAFDNASHSLDEYARGAVPLSADVGDAVLTAQTFSTLRAMVKAWHVEKLRAHSLYGALLADNFWRWACSARSALFEPALQRFLQRLMRKTLLQLLAEFRRVGVRVVHASYTRLFLLTNKPTAGSAAAFARYVMSAVTSRELFKHLSLRIVHFWEYLLFLDTTNMGGVIAHTPDAVAPSEATDIEMAWNIQAFLPHALQPRFAKLIGVFIYELYTAKCALLHKRQGRPVMRAKAGRDTGAAVESTLEPSHLDDVREILSHGMARRLLRAVQDIQTEIKTSAGDSHAAHWAFPQLPGSHLALHSPALEFVKACMQVLALHRECALEAQICKRSLLDLLGVREFAPQAAWQNPCASFQLPWVICEFCNDDRTLDLCRDADLIEHAWRCAQCDFPYDRAAIESRLLAQVQHVIAQHAVQDLHCARCNRTKTSSLAPYCTDALRKLRQAHAIAAFHEFPVLRAAVETHLACIVEVPP
ncbi:Pol2p [Malassezia vespertilionis]|uniref:DNA polymerase epsilon catalytic subunit n=1 Tax=Malassezia vespertilionis TaxID=2020962 RepID=A0A2N1J871_9BASI|nr:Pol2p [Malassezia vespertilionis]